MTAVITDVKYRMSLSLIRDLRDAGITVTACHSGGGRPFAFSSRPIRTGISKHYINCARKRPKGATSRLCCRSAR